MSTIGSSTWSSQVTNAASTTNAMANDAIVLALPQPFVGASISPYTRATMPTIDSSAPIGSSRASCGSRDFGITNLPKIRAMMMTGTLMRKIEPNQKWPSKKPLATGPNAPAAPVMLAQIAIAFGRSFGGKMLMMIDSVDGMISAAP